MSDHPRPRPTTLVEAIQYLYDEMDEANRQKLKAMDRDATGGLHFTLGLYIRNELGLWSPNNALMDQDEMIEFGPDAASSYLLEKLWDYLHGINIEYSTTPKIYPTLKTIDEAVQYLYDEMDELERQAVKALAIYDLAFPPLTFLSSIEDKLGLRRRNSTLMQLHELRALTAEDVSTHLLRKLWDYLRNEDKP